MLKLSDMKKVGHKPGGSSAGATYQDSDGQKWIIKSYGNDDQAKSEVLASKLMQQAKIGVADMELIDLGSEWRGGLGVASKHIGAFEDIDPRNELHRKAASKDLAVHAWLANWDTIGLVYDNTVMQNGKAVHIDPGGSLEYRAMGGKKGDRFGPQVGELKTLRDPHMNPTSAKIYKDMSPADLKASIKKVTGVSDKKIKDLVQEYGPGNAHHKTWLAQLLIDRKEDLKRQSEHTITAGVITMKINAAYRLRAAENDFKESEHPRDENGQFTLYHGTSADAAESIKKNGFRPTRSGMYGDGVYFTEDHGKADFFSKGGKVLKVDMPDKSKFKRFKNESEYEDFKYTPEVEDRVKKLRAEDPKLDEMEAQDKALNQVLKEQGFLGHSVKRKDSEYYVVPDPDTVKNMVDA